MSDHSPLLTKEGFPVIRTSPPQHVEQPSLRRLSGAVKLANVMVAILGLLSTPLAIVSPMNLGMSYASANAFKNDPIGLIQFQVLCLVTVGLPFICLVSIAGSLYLGCHGNQRRALQVAMVPLLALLILVLLFATGDS